MKRPLLIVFSCLLRSLIAVAGTDPSDCSFASAPPPAAFRSEREPIKPIPVVSQLDARLVALGEALFHEPQLSHDDTVSCALCHDLARGGVDGLDHPVGIHHAVGTMNVPTVFNSGFNFKQSWDGRADTLEAQVDEPLLSATEMGATWEEVVRKLRGIPRYAASFREIFPDGIQPPNVRHALAEYVRSLATSNCRFDQYLRGNDTALTARELAGYEEFKGHGCTSCHQGVNVGGNMFETLGIMADYFGQRGHITKVDFGRFNVTGREKDRFVFKVPSLRNVALTAPYFHDGSVARLEDAVRIMGTYQLGDNLSADEVDSIVAFLKTLTGEYQGHAL